MSSWRPRVKPEHAAFRLSGNRVRIGGSVFGIAAEVVDESGAVWDLLRSADGSSTAQQLADRLHLLHPAWAAEDALAALRDFDEAGYLEDAAAGEPAELSARERERYDRGRLFYRWIDLTPRASSWEPQLRLRSSRVTIVGIGGTGGTAALALAASGVGHLHVVDFDRVELSNLNRQVLFTESDVGRPKVAAALVRLRALNSDISVTGQELRIAGERDFAPLLDGCDVLVLCADRPGDIRTWANRACIQARTPWVDAGYHGPVVSAAAYVPGRGPCYECVWRGEFDRWKDDDPDAGYPDAGYTTGRGQNAAVIAPSAGLSGHLAAHLTLALVTGAPAVEAGRIQGLNLVRADDHYLVEHSRHPQCTACAPEAAPPRRTEGGQDGKART
jgi:molybdopterin/thiamine biosynthesis adenylyltransferase